MGVLGSHRTFTPTFTAPKRHKESILRNLGSRARNNEALPMQQRTHDARAQVGAQHPHRSRPAECHVLVYPDRSNPRRHGPPARAASSGDPGVIWLQAGAIPRSGARDGRPAAHQGESSELRQREREPLAARTRMQTTKRRRRSRRARLRPFMSTCTCTACACQPCPPPACERWRLPPSRWPSLLGGVRGRR